MIPINDWKWIGRAGHFCSSSECEFHLTTIIGQYVISTIGEYYPFSEPRVMAEIGHKRLYETMVFKINALCMKRSCSRCGYPLHSGMELDFRAYNTRGDAQRGHIEMCLKWADRKGTEVKPNHD